jgi:hypothetical protein
MLPAGFEGLKPPKSNGGLPLSGYIIERRDNKRPTWVKVDKVSPDTTTYKANNMLEGNMYNYRIKRGRPPLDFGGFHDNMAVFSVTSVTSKGPSGTLGTS